MVDVLILSGSSHSFPIGFYRLLFDRTKKKSVALSLIGGSGLDLREVMFSVGALTLLGAFPVTHSLVSLFFLPCGR